MSIFRLFTRGKKSPLIAKKEIPVGVTDNPLDPRLGHGPDTGPRSQNEVYLVLSKEERMKPFMRPYRDTYVHVKCGMRTKMGVALSETYARDPKFYGSTYCFECQMHLPVSEFNWLDGAQVGS